MGGKTEGAGRPRRKIKDRPAEAEFIKRYVDPASETLGNQTQSWIATHHNKSRQGAATASSRFVREYRNDIAEYLVEIGCGPEQRAEVMRDIVLGRVKHTTTTTYRDKEGKVSSSVETERTATPGERSNAMKVISSWTGDAERPKMVADLITDELRARLKIIHRQATETDKPGKAV